jgi:hypothetical protein
MNNQRKYSLWQAVPHSFTSRDFYRDVAENWKGLGLSFLLISCPVAALTTALILTSSFFLELRPLEAVSSQLPEIAVKDGRLVAPATPLRLVSASKTAIVLDPTGQQTSARQADTKFLVSGKQFVINANGKDTAVELGLFKRDWSLNGPQFVETLKQISLSFAGVVFVISALIEPLFKITGAAILAGLAKLIRAPRSFNEIMRLLLAITIPVSILSIPVQLALLFFKAQLHNLPNHICTFISLMYVVFAFRASRRQTDKSKIEEPLVTTVN